MVIVYHASRERRIIPRVAREISVYVVAHSRLSQEDEATRGSRSIQGVPEKGRPPEPRFSRRDVLQSTAIIVAHVREDRAKNLIESERRQFRVCSRRRVARFAVSGRILQTNESGWDASLGRRRRKRTLGATFSGTPSVRDSRLSEGHTFVRAAAAAYFTWPGLSEGAVNVSALPPPLFPVEARPRDSVVSLFAYLSLALCNTREAAASFSLSLVREGGKLGSRG